MADVVLCSAMRCCPPKDVVIDALSAEPIRRRRVERGNTPTLNPPEREGGERERDGGRGGVWGLVPDTSFRCEDVPNCIARDFRHVNRTEPTDTKKKEGGGG